MEEDIYILPVLLDDCKVPYNLEKFHWQKFNDEKAIENIVEAINYQRKKYIDSLSSDEIELNSYITESLELQVNDLLKFIDFKCSYPKFNHNIYFDANFVNSIIASKFYEILSDHRKYIIEEKKWIIEKANIHNYIYLSFNIIQLNESLLSIEIVDDSFINWAHPNTYFTTINILFNPERLISISDLIEYQDFESFIKECIKNYGERDLKDSLMGAVTYFNERTFEFTISPDKITLILANHLPRVILLGGFIEIPLKDLKSKLLTQT